jgi:TPR repeat protein
MPRLSWGLLVALALAATAPARVAAAQTPLCRRFADCSRLCGRSIDGKACFQIGLRYQKGLGGLPTNEATAAIFYRRACERGVAAGCTNIGYYTYWGKAGLAIDKVRGAAYYRKGCNGGDNIGCNNLASAYAWGSGVPLDFDLAIRLFRRACAAGVTLACKNATDTERRRAAAPRRGGTAPPAGGGGIQEKRPLPRGDGAIHEKPSGPGLGARRPMPYRALESPTTAAARYRRQCSPDQPVACFELGFLQINSWALPWQPKEGVRLLTQACDGGLGDACSALGELAAGERRASPTQSVTRAAEFLRRGCAAQSGRACLLLGSLYRMSDSFLARAGMKSDVALGNRLIAQGRGLLERECDDAVPRACTWLGRAVAESDFGGRDAAAGRALMQRGCDGGDLDGCEHLGRYYYSGLRGTATDRSRGVTLFRRACDGGLARGCARLADAYRWGRGVPVDLGRARTLLGRACPKDSASCWELGRAWERAPDGVRDNAKAEAAYRDGCDAGDSSCCGALKRLKVETGSASKALKECDQGRADGCLAYAEMLKSGRGVAQDGASAVSFFLRACEGGIGAGCVGLGLLLRDGATGLTSDAAGAREAFQKAVPIFSRECPKRRPDACADLADLYCDGTMLPRDPKKVLALLERGCSHRHWASCNKLGGRLLRGGCGVVVKPEKAVRVIGKACDAGDDAACDALVHGYLEGYYLKKDPAQGLRWMERACDRGMGRYCQRLGSAHEWGDYGRTKDLPKALRYYQRACAKGVTAACTRHKTLADRLAKGR